MERVTPIISREREEGWLKEKAVVAAKTQSELARNDNELLLFKTSKLPPLLGLRHILLSSPFHLKRDIFPMGNNLYSLS